MAVCIVSADADGLLDGTGYGEWGAARRCGGNEAGAVGNVVLAGNDKGEVTTQAAVAVESAMVVMEGGARAGSRGGRWGRRILIWAMRPAAMRARGGEGGDVCRRGEPVAGVGGSGEAVAGYGGNCGGAEGVE